MKKRNNVVKVTVMLDMDDENLRKIYECYWLHAMHQETQRLWFTNIYAVIVAGVFAYFSYIESNIVKVFILIFLTILSLFGYLITQSWNIPFVIFSRLAEEIAICEWRLPNKYLRFAEYNKGYKFCKGIGFWKISMRISAARLFMAFYSLMVSFFAALTSQMICQLNNIQTITIAIVLFIVFYLYYLLYWEQKTINKIQNDFNRRVEKMTKLEENDELSFPR